MIINELSSTNIPRHVTVTLNYEETRDLANAMYTLSGFMKSDEYKDIAAKAAFLFDMVKEGMIQPHSVEQFHEINRNTARRMTDISGKPEE